MENTEQKQSPSESFKTIFARGLVLIIPIVITVWVLNSLFNTVDGIISPVFDQILQRHVHGLGFMTMIVLILLVGLLSRNLFGNALFRLFEKVIGTIPVARTIYGSMKEVINALQLGGKGRSFKHVVLIEYPRHGLYTMGFLTNEMALNLETGTTEVASVYIPNPPNPTSGMLVLVPRSEIRILEMTVETGLKMVLSAGMVAVPELTIQQQSFTERKTDQQR